MPVASLGGRDRDAFIGRHAGAGELGDDPTIGKLIVKDHRVAIAGGLANSAEAGPELNDLRSKHGSAGGLIKDLVTFVDDLHVLGRADFAVCIGRRAVASDAWERNAIEIEDGGRDRRRKFRKQRRFLHHRVWTIHMLGDDERVLTASCSWTLCTGQGSTSRNAGETSL